MPKYTYTGRFSNGEAAKGEVQASSQEEVVMQLGRESITPIRIDRSFEQMPVFSFLKSKFLGIFSIDKRDFRLFAMKMSVLLRSGVPIRQAVGDLADASPSPVLKDTLKKVEGKLIAGYNLPSSFSGHPNVFSELYISFLTQAQNNGKSYQVFDQLAKTLDLQHRIRQKLFSPLLPYLFTTIVIIAVTAFLSEQTLPMFEAARAKSKFPLPSSTIMLMDFMKGMQHWYYFLFGMIGVSMVFAWLYRFDLIRLKVDQFLLKMPLSGKLLREYALGEFLRACVLALENGLNIQDAIRIASAVLRNGYLKQQMSLVFQRLQTGEQVWAAMNRSHLFSVLDVHLLRLGEQTNEMRRAIENMVSLNNEAFEHELAVSAETLKTILIALLAGAVVMVAFGFYFGLWTLSNMSY
jgi:MSHA biogenesis protein MshG